MRFAKTEAVRRNMPVVVCGVKIRSDGTVRSICAAPTNWAAACWRLPMPIGTDNTA
uniref:GspH/FimT family pseudopilin n=1 Tax=Conchiformibius kuhniae TaxID=211502 RepID=A0A8T9MWJ6_9NEIS|nr:GspH/FimT family pseudopilin [Conchiformibius kuhniae]